MAGSKKAQLCQAVLSRVIQQPSEDMFGGKDMKLGIADLIAERGQSRERALSNTFAKRRKHKLGGFGLLFCH
jgi:hypothetical protein